MHYEGIYLSVILLKNMQYRLHPVTNGVTFLIDKILIFPMTFYDKR